MKTSGARMSRAYSSQAPEYFQTSSSDSASNIPPSRRCSATGSSRNASGPRRASRSVTPTLTRTRADGGRRSGEGADQSVDGCANAVGLRQFCQRLRIAGCGRTRSFRIWDGRDADRDADPTRALDVCVGRVAQLAAGDDAVEILVPPTRLGGVLLPHAGHAGKPIRRVAAQHRVVAVRPTRDAVATLDLRLIDDQKVADSALRV